ncbi:hypothetical protein [Bradyrhizobium sp. USDA 10063]
MAKAGGARDCKRISCAIIPLVIVIVAYAQRIPIPPELALAGDLLAYIDVFSVLLLLGVLGRVTTILFVAKQAGSYALKLPGRLRAMMQRPDVRHRRDGSAQNSSRLSGRVQNDDDPPVTEALAWA